MSKTYIVVDTSKFNGAPDWDKAKDHIDGVILQVGFGSDIPTQDDPQAIRTIEACERLGIPWGPYIYSYANTAAMIKSEYIHCKRMCQGHKPTLPWYIDLEENRLGLFSKIAATEWCRLAKADGNKYGIYTGAYYFRNFMTGLSIPGASYWIAAYGTNDGTKQDRFKPSIGIEIDGWQYTSRGKIPGITGNVDVSEFYTLFGADEKKDETPVSPAKPVVAKKSIDEMADEIIADEGNKVWKTNDERIRLLTKAGYDANAVQKRINEKLGVANTITYIVKPGDTLSAIGRRYGISYSKIAVDNKISNPNKIYVGQKIVIKR